MKIILLVIIVVILIVFLCFKKESPLKIKVEKCHDCKVGCKVVNRKCKEGCSRLIGRGRITCQSTCDASSLLCTQKCPCPKDHVLRNASFHQIAVFNRVEQLLGTLNPGTERFKVKDTDFPITFCLIEYARDSPCKNTNQKISYTIHSPGCYIIWGGGGVIFTTTSMICYND